jgi:hypothetical protein
MEQRKIVDETVAKLIKKATPYCLMAKDRLVDSVKKIIHGPPPAITPLFKRAKKGEGIWSAGDFPTCDGVHYFYKTWVRPDLARPYSVLYLVSIDISKLELHLVAGTEEPISTSGIHGKGRVPKKYIEEGRLACIFNGGFRTKHGRWGFISEGITYRKPKKGIATIAVDENGKIYLGRWGTQVKGDHKYVYLRQNLEPIIEDGKINKGGRYWGASIDGKTHVWRSGIGITADGKRLIFGVGTSLSNKTLAKGLAMAGCVNGMQLDINDYHTYFIYYLPKIGEDGRIILKPKKLTPKISAEKYRGMRAYTRDFFYMVWKEDRKIAKR